MAKPKSHRQKSTASAGKVTSAILENHLWEAANLLRDSIGPSDYQTYVFEVLFLKRLNDVFESESVRDGIKPQKDEIRKKHAISSKLIISAAARWDNIRGLKENVLVALGEANKALAQANPHLSVLLDSMDLSGSHGFSDSTLVKLIEHFDGIRLRDEDLQSERVLGVAFDWLLERLYRNQHENYPFPHQIASFMVSALRPDPESMIIDPACGTGGFLLENLKYLGKRMRRKTDGSDLEKRIRDFAKNQLFGVELNIHRASIAMMRMMLHEGVYAEVRRGDILQDEFRNMGEVSEYSYVLTSSPIGFPYGLEPLYEHYDLGKGRKRQRREILYLEKCISLLAPGGLLGIVLPSNILSFESFSYVREFLMDRSRILGIISLPSATFSPAGYSIRTSMLFLRKKHSDDENLGNYPLFMAIAEKVGYDKKGRSNQDDLPGILRDFRKFLEENLK